MKVVLQRVSKASVKIDKTVYASINLGILVLVGIENDDTQDDIDWLTKKITNLRIFDDENGVMNLSLKQVDGEVLLISQFTLHASTKKGNRPSYIKAARPDIAVPLYEAFITTIQKELNKEVQTGVFGAHMYLDFINDGPVTIIIDSKNKQ